MTNSDEKIMKPNIWQRSVISIAIPEGHNYVQKKQWLEDVDLKSYSIRKRPEPDGRGREQSIYLRPEAKGKSFYQLYLGFPIFVLVSTIAQVN